LPAVAAEVDLDWTRSGLAKRLGTGLWAVSPSARQNINGNNTHIPKIKTAIVPINLPVALGVPILLLTPVSPPG